MLGSSACAMFKKSTYLALRKNNIAHTDVLRKVFSKDIPRFERKNNIPRADANKKHPKWMFFVRLHAVFRFLYCKTSIEILEHSSRRQG